MGRDSRDPTVIRSVAVTADDVVAAVEARRQRGEPVVLRITPPFSGRVRGRLHVRRGETDRGTVHIDPEDLLRVDAPDYPSPADTEDELRADPGVEYTVERHHDRHAAAVAEWREAVRDQFVEEVTVETPTGTHRIEVTVLG